MPPKKGSQPEIDIGALLDVKLNPISEQMQAIFDKIGNFITSDEAKQMIEEETADLRQEMHDMKRENDDLKAQMKQQGEVLKQQQMFLEKIDSKERRNNLIITGIPEAGGTGSDLSKVKKIFETLGGNITDGSIITSTKRLGIEAADRARPILVVVTSMAMRNRIVDASRSCTHASMNGIRIKKDAHPAVRAEWKRLFETKEAEERKPENVDRNIVLNIKKRQVTCDGQVIDSWCHQLF